MEAVFDHRQEGGRIHVRPAGDWVIEQATRLDEALRAFRGELQAAESRQMIIDLGSIESMDTAGAYLLARLERRFVDDGGDVAWRVSDKSRAALLDRVRNAVADDHDPPRPRHESIVEDVGATVISVSEDARRLLNMLGAVVQELGYTIRHPSTFRTTAVIKQMEVAGLRAVPIVAVMSVLIGGIIAQQGAFQLRFFGAAIFTVDLVGILSLREMCTLLTAIMVAGRSGSAITAELGSMKMREEIDALRVMGLDPVNVLILPRVISLIIVLPLLTFLSGLCTLLGAMLTCWLYIDITPVVFITRLRDAIDFSSLFSGLLKAPFMGLIIALIACAEGMAVRGSAESLGQRTTASVVKAIFMVIVVDGIFAIFYSAIDF
jgi:phospholipid/cholesterol/gamma-HCH transport system permease protein